MGSKKKLVQYRVQWKHTLYGRPQRYPPVPCQSHHTGISPAQTNKVTLLALLQHSLPFNPTILLHKTILQIAPRWSIKFIYFLLIRSRVLLNRSMDYSFLSSAPRMGI